MNEHDHKFENYLREFTPRRPRALPSSAVNDLQWRRLAAAAVLAISVGSMAWFALHNERQSSAPPSKELSRRDEGWRKFTLIQWTHLADEDPRALDANLDEASRESLPSFNKANSSLRALAKP